MSCFFMIRTENNKTNLLESLSSYPSIIGDIGVKNGLESYFYLELLFIRFAKEVG
jgi:hypothetical protein